MLSPVLSLTTFHLSFNKLNVFLQPPKSGKGSAKSPKSNKKEKERQKKEEAEQKAAAEGRPSVFTQCLNPVILGCEFTRIPCF